MCLWVNVGMSPGQCGYLFIFWVNLGQCGMCVGQCGNVSGSMSVRLRVNVIYLWVNVGMPLGQSGISVGQRVPVSGSMWERFWVNVGTSPG